MTMPSLSSRIRTWWLILAFVSGFAAAMVTEELILSWHENRIEFTAPRLHFLAGKPLQALHDGAPVPFDFQITMWSGSRNHVFRRTADRFVVSYDLWEEKFSVVRLQSPRKMISHLTATRAEAWCLEQMPLDIAGVSDFEPLWARLEIRAQNAKEPAPIFGRGSLNDSGISLTSLIEIFSRPAQAQQSHWTVDTGPLTLDDVKRGHASGS
jgi:hypothetical protein